MIYELHLDKRYFDLIASGKKRIEGRIVKPERAGMKPGDIIVFYDDEGRRLRCRVKDVRFYESIEEMVRKEGYKNLVPDAESEEEVIKIYYGFYPEGGRCMAIELEGCEYEGRHARTYHALRRVIYGGGGR